MSSNDKISNSNETNASKEEVVFKKRKRVKIPKSKKPYKKVIFISIVVLLVLTAVCVGLCLLNCSGENSLHNNDDDLIEYNGNKYKYNENLVNILFIGYDKTAKDERNGKQGQSDLLMIFVLDTSNGSVKLMSIPRDTMVEAGQFVGEGYLGLDKKMQIALSYAYGDGEHSSCKNTLDSVTRLLFNMPISKYAALNMDGIGPINDSVGGVFVNALETIPSTVIEKGKDIVLLGNNARKYVQYRNAKETYSSENRRQRQIQYVQSFFSNSILGSQNLVGTVVDLFNAANSYVISNMGIDELVYLAKTMYEAKMGTLQTINIPGEYSQNGEMVEYNVDVDRLYELVLDTFYVKQ